jgi:hypothetical protein
MQDVNKLIQFFNKNQSHFSKMTIDEMQIILSDWGFHRNSALFITTEISSNNSIFVRKNVAFFDLQVSQYLSEGIDTNYIKSLIHRPWIIVEERSSSAINKLTNTRIISQFVCESDISSICDDINKIRDAINSRVISDFTDASSNFICIDLSGFKDSGHTHISFFLKNTYINAILQKELGDKKFSNLREESEFHPVNMNDYIIDLVSKYYGFSEVEIASDSLMNKGKITSTDLARSILGLDTAPTNIGEIAKAKISIRFIKVDSNGRVNESLSFPAFDFNEIVKTTWENSIIRKTLFTTKFLFFVFMNHEDRSVFIKAIFWNMPLSVIEGDVKRVWSKTISVLKSGEIVNKIDKDGTKLTNFPGQTYSSILHVRPHARDSADVSVLPKTDILTGAKTYTKQGFWLNQGYITELLSLSKKIKVTPKPFDPHSLLGFFEDKLFKDLIIKIMDNRKVILHSDFIRLVQSNEVDTIEFGSKQVFIGSGYSYYFDLVYSDEFLGYHLALKYFVQNNDYYYIPRNLNNDSSYLSIIESLVKDKLLYQTSRYKFITTKSLNNSNHDISCFLAIEDKIACYANTHDLLSVEKTISDNNISYLSKYFDVEAYVVFLFDKLKLLSINFGKDFLFSYKFNIRLEILKNQFLQNSVVDVQTVISHFKDIYGVNYTYAQIISDASKCDMHFNKESGLLFINKEAFYRGVWGS